MFFIGFFIANNIKTKEQIKCSHILTAICIALILYFGFKVYTALTIPITIAIGYIIKWMCQKRLFNSIFLFFGKISLESYLTNIYLLVLFGYIDFGVLGYGNYLKCTLAIAVGVPLAYLMNNVCNKLITHKKG